MILQYLQTLNKKRKNCNLMGKYKAAYKQL